jgi:hypothetical protein
LMLLTAGKIAVTTIIVAMALTLSVLIVKTLAHRYARTPHQRVIIFEAFFAASLVGAGSVLWLLAG